MDNFRRLAALFLCGVLLLANDGWKLPVQIYAWSQMFSTNVQTMSARDALVKTFSGKEPCRICKHLLHASSQLQGNQDSYSSALPEFTLPVIVVRFTEPKETVLFTPYKELHSIWYSEKPKRPPRLVG